MIRLQREPTATLLDLRERLQQAIVLEWSTLPPYLYALYSIRFDSNAPARQRILDIVHEEMQHMMLACNILNAIGGSPSLTEAASMPSYPGPLPYDIGSEQKDLFEVHLLPFSRDAMAQAMRIEEPEAPIAFPQAVGFAGTKPEYHTIGQFYRAVNEGLHNLPSGAWAMHGRNQIGDQPFFAGEVFPVLGYEDARRAISRIISQGEGAPRTPIDFEGDVSHFYRFEEIHRDQLLIKSEDPTGYAWGEPLGLDFEQVSAAIPDPATRDFSDDPDARRAQDTCDRAFTEMIRELDRAVNGEQGRLGNAVRAMFDLRMAAFAAFSTPLKGDSRSAGPAFRFRPDLA